MLLSPGDKIKHYKGGIYEVVCRATHTETREDMIIYKDKEGNYWVRPESMFDDAIPVSWVRRFEKLT